MQELEEYIESHQDSFYRVAFTYVKDRDAALDVVQNAVQQEHWQVGLGNLLFMISLITVNVGVFNLLPVPALDGGRLVFLIIEGVTRHKVPAKYEGLIHAIGLILLLILMVFVTFGDIGRLLRGGW